MTVETDVASLTQATQDLLAAVQVRKADLDAKVAAASGSLSAATAQAGIATQKAAEAADKATLAGQKSDIATAQAAIATQKASDATDMATLAGQKSDIATAQAGIATQKAAEAADKATLAGQKSDIATAQAAIATQKASDAADMAALAGQKSDIANAQAGIATQKAGEAADSAAAAAAQAAAIPGAGNLADPDDAAKGAGLVGFSAALAYAAGTVGAWLKSLTAPGGAGIIGFLHAVSGAYQRTVGDKLSDFVSVCDFMTQAQIVDVRAGTRTTDVTSAYLAALATGYKVRVPVGISRVTDTISWENADLIGEGWGAIIEADIADPSKPLLNPGRTALINNLTLRYATSRITGSETQGQRVLIGTWGGPHGYVTQRGSEIRDVQLGLCGTAIYSPASPEKPAFSVTFDTLEVADCTYRGIDLESDIRTGNVYRNIYIKSSYTIDTGFRLYGEESECVIDQLNIEHTACRNAPVHLHGVRALAAGTIHIEGCDVTTPNSAYLKFENSAGSIESLSIYYTRMTQDNTAIVGLGSIHYDDFGGQVNPDVLKYLRIGTLHLKGVAKPDYGLYPTYPSNRYGLVSPSVVAGFNIFSRPLTASANRDMFVQVDCYAWDTSSTPNDSSVYQAFPADPNSNIAFISKGQRGQNVNGATFAGPMLMVGADDTVQHPMLYDRAGHSYRPAFTRWYDDNTGIAFPAQGEVGVTVGNSDKFRFKSVGGKSILYAGAQNNNAHPLMYDRDGDSYLPTFTWWYDDNTGISRPAQGEVGITLGNVDKYRFKASGFAPAFDNSVSCGLASNRFSVYYAATNSISTSDERYKTAPIPIDKAVMRAWSRVHYCQYKFLDAVAEKGDGARWHFGVIAQRVREAFEAEGLDAFAYGILCYDRWDAVPEIKRVMRIGDIVRIEDQAVVYRDVEEPTDQNPLPDGFEWVLRRKEEVLEQQYRPAGDRYGVREVEALMLEAALLRSRLDAAGL